MILKKGTFDAFSRDINSNDSKIIIFGTGVIGTTVLPEIIKKYGLADRLQYCIDNDELKIGTSISICNKCIPIYSPKILGDYNEKLAVLISMSRFQGALEQLEKMELSDNVSCYIIPAMFVENNNSFGNKGVIKSSGTQVIPKVIHYMWLGNSKLNETSEKCIESWKKYCPDYEIIRWDESNYDVHKNTFMSQAYDNGRYGFVPDYARIELLYEYGGIYLDTDVELIKNIDELLYQESFCGVEKWQVLNFGGCSGAVKGHHSLEPFLEKWSERKLIQEDGSMDKISSGKIDTEIAIKYGFEINGLNQTINGMNIYTYDYFHPYDYMSGKVEITNDTFSIHRFNGGWLDIDFQKNNINQFYDKVIQRAVVV